MKGKQTAALSRREMFRGAFALGGVAVGSAAFGEDAAATAPSSATGMGPAPARSFSYAHIHAGASSPFSVFHISDSHLTEAEPGEPSAVVSHAKKRTGTFCARQMESVRSLVDFAKKCSDLIVHTGDLLDFHSKGNVAAAKEVFALAPDMFFGCIGNHEYYRHGAGSAKRHAKACAAAFPYDLTFDSRVLNGVNFVSMDDALWDQGGANGPTAVQRERFAKEVEKGLPIILCVHVPLHTPDIIMATAQYWKNRSGKFRNSSKFVPKFNKDTKDFIAYLKGEPLLKAILSGHEHIAMEERFSPTAVQFMAPGGFAFAGRHVLIT